MVITLTVFGAYFYLKDVMNTEAPGLHPRTMGVRRLFFSGDSKKFPGETKHSVCLNKNSNWFKPKIKTSTQVKSDMSLRHTLYYFFSGWIPLVALMLYVMSFSTGFGPIPWLMMGEIFPGRCQFRQRSMSSSWASRFMMILLVHSVKHTD